MALEFEWDDDKAYSNSNKHGVTFEEAKTVFGDKLAMTKFDEEHSSEEERYVILGESGQLRLLVVAFTERDERIRIISARVANKRERKRYEEGS
jgi:uncharacterized DUF497 family protein